MKKEIGFVLKGYPRLSETFIAQEIYLLEQAGFNIRIFSMRQAREKIRQPINDKIKANVTYLPEYFKDAPFSMIYHNLRASLIFGSSYFKGLGIALRKKKEDSVTKPFKRFFQAAWLASTENLHQKEVQHLHSHFIHAPTELTYYISHITGLTYSISAHAKDIYTISEKDVIERVNRSEFIMTCTQFNVDHLRGLRQIDQSKVHKVYHGIDLQFFMSKTLPQSETEKKRLITVGRLVEKKGYKYAIEAIRRVKDQGINLIYDIYGAGDLKPVIEKQIRDLNLTDTVFLKGHATHDELLEELKKSDVYLNSSIIAEDGDRDGIPNTIAEAMALRIPVIASNVSGIPELVEHRKTGLIVEQKSVDELTDAISNLLQNSDLRKNLALGARDKVEDVFDSQKCIKNCISLMESYG